MTGADDLVAALHIMFGDGFPPDAHDQVGTAGLALLPSGMARPIGAALPRARAADKLVFDAARTKTDEEIGNAREAARIAELGYTRLLEIARPGMTEDELAVELKD